MSFRTEKVQSLLLAGTGAWAKYARSRVSSAGTAISMREQWTAWFPGRTARLMVAGVGKSASACGGAGLVEVRYFSSGEVEEDGTSGTFLQAVGKSGRLLSGAELRVGRSETWSVTIWKPGSGAGVTLRHTAVNGRDIACEVHRPRSLGTGYWLFASAVCSSAALVPGPRSPRGPAPGVRPVFLQD
ncbi:hypothetical protein [Kitasatospora sp. NPDC001175]|uniref:hypothetical protein n=1 Tax=Kitasatospora sp. NPDC001175 TaxID=3157103 RepID=UPI003D02660A